MPLSGWMRKRTDAPEGRGTVRHWFAQWREATRWTRCLDFGVQALLATAAGDRAGLWLAGSGAGKRAGGA